MKASELIAELQKGIADGRDWDVVTSSGNPVQVVYNMPTYLDRGLGLKPYITLAWNDCTEEIHPPQVTCNMV